MENNEPVVLQPENTKSADGLVSGFFAVGIVINIVMVVAYFVWAWRQWGKKDKSESSK